MSGETRSAEMDEKSKQNGSLNDVPPEWNRLTEQVIAAAMEVHSALGPGLIERLYEEALCHELSLRRIPFRRQVPVALSYKDHPIGDQTLDLVVAELVVLELKSVDRVHEVHLRQLVSYMRSKRLPLGLLINFDVDLIKNGLYRRVLTRNIPVSEAFLKEV